MRGVAILLGVAGFLCAAGAVYLLRIAYEVDVSADAGGMAVANLAQMHLQSVFFAQGIGAAICAAIFIAAAGIAATIERPA